MKKLLYLVVAIIALASCRNTGSGELTGVPDRPKSVSYTHLTLPTISSV